MTASQRLTPNDRTKAIREWASCDNGSEPDNIPTPLEPAIQNEIDRFSLVIDAIDRIPALRIAGAHVQEKMRDMQIECRNYTYEHGVDLPEADNWVWPD